MVDAAGKPVAGAALQVDRAVGRGGSVESHGQVRRQGALRLSAWQPGPSRVVEFSYGAATSQVTVRVRAGVTLRTSRKVVRNGKTLKFSGQVRGDGKRAVLVTIYALASGPRKRIPVETVRASSEGRFSYSYRFRKISGPTRYRFEARVPKQTGFPYLEGASRAVVVRGRP